MSATNEIPVLSMPTSTTSSSAAPINTENHSPTLLQSPASSVAESFRTPTEGENHVNSRYPLAFPQSLRKSVSVDSFAEYSRESLRSSRGYSVSDQNASQNLVYGPSPDFPSRPENYRFSAMHRGESFNTLYVEQDSSPSESDIDRYDPLTIPPTGRFRHSSLKNQEMHKPFVRGGELPLPSRAQQNTSLKPLNINDMANFSTFRPSLTSHSSFDSSKRGNSYTTLNFSRSRSGSLGIYVANSYARKATNSQSSSPQPLGNPIVIAVIGTSGSGKSAVIRRGLSGFHLTDPTLVSGSTDTSNLPRFLRRTSDFLGVDIPHSSSSSSSPQRLEVIEVEIQTTDNSLLDWPQCLSPVDGVIICYDSSSESSYQPVEGLLKSYRSQMLPVMVLGCKADLEHAIKPFDASTMLQQHDAGLIEVSTVLEGGKEKMKQSFVYMMLAVLRQRGPSRIIDDRNPASPELPYQEPPWEKSRINTPVASPPSPSPKIGLSTLLNTTIPEDPDFTGLTSSPTSPPPILAQLTDDSISKLDALEPLTESSDILPTESEETQQRVSSLDTIEDPLSSPEAAVEQQFEEKKTEIKKESRRTQWAYLSELLEKLLFLVVSGDDPTFITHFLLTYRRFSTPRSVLLAMQKRMRQLDDPCGDPMFACFAQMRICCLLETWIREYPHDFAVRGTVGALNALIKSIISKTHLLHYGSGFLPFLEQLPSLVDQDAGWALKADISDTDSDDYTLEDDDDDDDDNETRVAETETVESTNSRMRTDSSSSEINFPSRERKTSIPLPKPVLSSYQVNQTHVYSNEFSPKQHIRDLVKVAQDVLSIDSAEIAEEITRRAVKQFLIIKPRDWLQFTLVSAKKSGESIPSFNGMSNHLADWVVSLILCHERPRHRARQVEKFIDIAMKLRQMNNYSGLRAFVAGINNATDDPTMDALKSKSPDHLKNLQSWDVLLQQTRAHRSYRLALRNSKGACIPALEVHMSDLIKAHEGNGDSNDSDPLKIHWGKYNMMGGFVATTVQCQAQCRNSADYNFPERTAIGELLTRKPVMSVEMQKSRLKSHENEFDEYYPINNSSQPGLRKLFFR